MTKDLIDLLLEDHWRLERLLDRLESEHDPVHLPRLVGDLADLLDLHEAVETGLVAPAIGVQHEDGGELRHLFDELGRLDPGSHAYRKRATALVVTLRAHLSTEEDLVLPVLRSRVGPEELERLGHVAAKLRKERAVRA